MLPVLIYDDEDGNVRCTSCNICAKVCPPQCIWMSQAKGPKGNVVPLPEDFYIDMDVCMNCGLCAEYCPFDAIKMDQNFELSNYERHQTHIYSLQDLLVSSDYYSRTHPDAWSSDEEGGRAEQGRQEEGPAAAKALTATAKPAAPPKAAPKPVAVEKAVSRDAGTAGSRRCSADRCGVPSSRTRIWLCVVVVKPPCGRNCFYVWGQRGLRSRG